VHQVGDEPARGFVEPIATDKVVLHPVFDRLAPVSGRLDLQHAVARVEVGAGAHLEPAAPALHVVAVGEQVRGVEIDRLVTEEPTLADLQHAEARAEPVEERGQHRYRHYVLAVQPGLEGGLAEHLGQADRPQSCGRGG
jgi:hypothetical protein